MMHIRSFNEYLDDRNNIIPSSITYTIEQELYEVKLSYIVSQIKDKFPKMANKAEKIANNAKSLGQFIYKNAIKIFEFAKTTMEKNLSKIFKSAKDKFVSAKDSFINELKKDQKDFATLIKFFTNELPKVVMIEYKKAMGTAIHESLDDVWLLEYLSEWDGSYSSLNILSETWVLNEAEEKKGLTGAIQKAKKLWTIIETIANIGIKYTFKKLSKLSKTLGGPDIGELPAISQVLAFIIDEVVKFKLHIVPNAIKAAIGALQYSLVPYSKPIIIIAEIAVIGMGTKDVIEHVIRNH